MKQMTTAYVVRVIEHLKDVACDIRIAMRDDCVYSGALCEDTSATAPGSAFEYPSCIRYNPPPFLSSPLSNTTSHPSPVNPFFKNQDRERETNQILRYDTRTRPLQKAEKTRSFCDFLRNRMVFICENVYNKTAKMCSFMEHTHSNIPR